MRIGSLFSGIGGLELGLERATGGETVWQCERDPYCRSVLATHWPDATRYPEVADVWNPPAVDVICGGFPCQDLSRIGGIHGKIKGISGPRSGLWADFARIIHEVGPRLVFVENTPNLARRGLGVVLSDLHGLGFDAEWLVLSAAAIGAPQVRARLFLLAHARRERTEQRGEPVQLALQVDPQREQAKGGDQRRGSALRRGHCPYCAGSGEAWDPGTGEGPTCPSCGGSGRPPPHSWDSTPRFLTGPDGVPDRVARCRALGNAVVPAQAEAAFKILADRIGLAR